MTQYKSCWSLQNHLELGLGNDVHGFGNKVHACCQCFRDSKNVERGMVPVTEITQDRFPVQAIRDGRARLHAAIAADTQDDCRECVHLAAGDWPPPQYLAFGLTLNFWSHCNLACNYCYTTAPGFRASKVTYSIPAVIRDMLEGGHLNPEGQVTWGGGDISALPEFNETSLMFIDYGVAQDFKTSGYKFLIGVARAITEGKGVVEVSVDAGTRETYASYKGKDVWDTVVANILKYREHGPVKLKYIADFCNVGDADIAGFLNLITAVKPSLITVTPEYNSAWQDKFDPQTINGMAKLLHLVRQSGLPVHPLDDVEGNLLFPHMWMRIKEIMERMPT